MSDKDRVSILYEDDTSIDFNNLDDAKHHARVQGVMGVVEVHKVAEPAVCKHCGGTGVMRAKPERVLTRKQLETELSREDNDG